MNKDSVALLVIAHPDDEAMFFGPFLCKCLSIHAVVHILCLSNGNYDGLGIIREKELYDSANIFGIPRERVHIFRHELLEDGMDNDWPIDVAASMILSAMHEIHPNVVATFDEFGISGHANHISTFKAVQCIFQSTEYKASRNCMAIALESVSIFRKFLSIADYGFSLCYSDITVFSLALCRVFMAMKAHHSQFVWYRWIFVIMSRYSFINTFKKI